MADKKYDYSKSPWEKIKLADALKPKDDAMCHGARWWFVTPDDCILRYRGHSLQCNASKELAESILHIYPECRLEFVGMAFIDSRDWKSGI